MLILWLVVCGPIVIGAALTLLATPALARGEPAGWLYALWLWGMLFALAAVGLLLGRPMHLFIGVAAMTVMLLLVSRSAVRDQR